MDSYKYSHTVYQSPAKLKRLSNPSSPTSSVSLSERDNFAWSFSKAKRFSSSVTPTNAQLVCLPSTLRRDSGTSFGFGKRSTLLNISGLESPPPITYQRDLRFLKGPLPGPRFIQKLEKLASSNPNQGGSVPGPGSYECLSPFGLHAQMTTFKHKPKATVRSACPSPDAYKPLNTLTKQSRFSIISFGVGRRSNLGFSKF
jgi:hypothetical protein